MATPGQITKVQEIVKNSPRKELQEHINHHLPELLATHPKDIDPMKFWESLGWIKERHSMVVNHSLCRAWENSLGKGHMIDSSLSYIREFFVERSGKARIEVVLWQFGSLNFKQGMKRISKFFRPLNHYELAILLMEKEEYLREKYGEMILLGERAESSDPPNELFVYGSVLTPPLDFCVEAAAAMSLASDWWLKKASEDGDDIFLATARI